MAFQSVLLQSAVRLASPFSLSDSAHSGFGGTAGTDSDLDLVATYAPQARWSLLDRVRMKLELESLLGRQVDLLNRRALEKARRPLRAAAILAEAQPLYAES